MLKCRKETQEDAHGIAPSLSHGSSYLSILFPPTKANYSFEYRQQIKIPINKVHPFRFHDYIWYNITCTCMLVCCHSDILSFETMLGEVLLHGYDFQLKDVWADRTINSVNQKICAVSFSSKKNLGINCPTHTHICSKNKKERQTQNMFKLLHVFMQTSQIFNLINPLHIIAFKLYLYTTDNSDQNRQLKK